MRTRLDPVRAAVIGLALICAASSTQAFSSGSTGADGALNPTVDTEVVLPASGILNYSSINIPANVRVTFKKNTTNSPVVLLVSGDATIAGTIDVGGAAAANSGTSGDGVLADDGQPGAGGPGGYSGGRGGRSGPLDSTERQGGKGLGPGGGEGALLLLCNNNNYESSYAGYGGGGGGSYGVQGANGQSPVSGDCAGYRAGAAYGAAELLPLLGGSGGGGGKGGLNWYGSGGGGGGGAVLIAVSGTLTVVNSTGGILANGGAAGKTAAAGCSSNSDPSSTGGGGSGGAIRLVATTIAGNGTLSAAGGATGSSACGYNGGSGGAGRIRIEAETITRTAGSSPASSRGTPGPLFISGAPTLAIRSVGGVDVPPQPTGVADVKLPASATNPMTVVFRSTGIPVGNTIKLSVLPASGAEITGVSTALTGSTSDASASVSLNMPQGASVLQATVTYTVIVAAGESLSRFAEGERVERIRVTAGLDGKSVTRLITVSGREFVAPAEALPLIASGS